MADLGKEGSSVTPAPDADSGIARVQVLPKDDEHTESGRWRKFKDSLRSLFKQAVDEDLAGSAVNASKAKLDEQSYKNQHLGAQIENQYAEARLRHSEADRSSSFLEAERRLKEAQADKTEAEAAKIQAEAESIALENQLKLLEKFADSGMKFAPVIDDDGRVLGIRIEGTDSKVEQPLIKLTPAEPADIPKFTDFKSLTVGEIVDESRDDPEIELDTDPTKDPDSPKGK